ncbi:MAG: PAS domain S-box protein [Opitutaceae bacterium]|nr:PAS domain S-box protein [Opitutaceae bacterium]
MVKWYGTGVDIHETKELEQVASRLARRLTTTLESLTDAFFTVDREWNFTYVNSEAERLLRRCRAELLGRDLREFVPGATAGRFEQECRRAEREKVPVSLDEHFIPPATWVEIRIYPSEDGLTFALRDITQRRQDSERLRLQQVALEVASDSISVTDRAGRLEWVNPAFAARYGYTREEIIGRTPGELIKSGRHDQAFYQTMWKTILAGQVWTSEIINRCRDGLLVTEDIAITPIRRNDGRVTHFVAIKRDVTGRKQAAEKLQEQAALLDKAQDAIVVRDLEDRITYWNKSAERLYGWTAAEAVGQAVTDLLHRDLAAFRAATAATLEQGEWTGEIEQYARSGRKLTVAARWTLVRDAEGRAKSIFVINTDVTEKKKLEAQFLRAQRLESIGTLAGGIAHDLNNVLAPILISIDLFRTDESDPDRLELLRTIEKSAQHGAELVKQVLSFARGMEGNFVEVNLRHLARDLQQIVRDTFPKNIEFHLNSARDLWTIKADATQMHQVLMNLCVNARDAMPGGGRLTVSLENVVIDEANLSLNPDAKVGHHVVIEVADTGTGISPEVRDRIFDPFFTTKEVGKGTGLGLATVLTIVKGHGGYIDVQSEPGNGSTFSIFIPASAGAGTTEATVVEHQRLPRGSGEQVLVVDDEESVRYVTRVTLERFGYRVMLAHHGAEAVALYARHRADVAVVLIDMAMPVLDGPATIVALQSLNPDVKIVGSSGHVSGAAVTKAMGAGVQHFVPKPYTAEALLKTIAQVLGKPRSTPPFSGSAR